MLVQKSVTLALKMMKLLASWISLARRVPLTEIHSVQLIVVQLLGHIATRMDSSTRALFEGVLIVQVINYQLVAIKD